MFFDTSATVLARVDSTLFSLTTCNCEIALYDLFCGGGCVMPRLGVTCLLACSKNVISGRVSVAIWRVRSSVLHRRIAHSAIDIRKAAVLTRKAISGLLEEDGLHRVGRFQERSTHRSATTQLITCHLLSKQIQTAWSTIPYEITKI